MTTNLQKREEEEPCSAARMKFPIGLALASMLTTLALVPPAGAHFGPQPCNPAEAVHWYAGSLRIAANLNLNGRQVPTVGPVIVFDTCADVDITPTLNPPTEVGLAVVVQVGDGELEGGIGGGALPLIGSPCVSNGHHAAGPVDVYDHQLLTGVVYQQVYDSPVVDPLTNQVIDPCFSDGVADCFGSVGLDSAALHVTSNANPACVSGDGYKWVFVYTGVYSDPAIGGIWTSTPVTGDIVG